MKRSKSAEDRFHIAPTAENAVHESLVRDPGVVSGEITSRLDTRAERLLDLQGYFLQDEQLARYWEETARETNALARTEALLDRINAERHALDASDATADHKKKRHHLLSALANRLRELI